MSTIDKLRALKVAAALSQQKQLEAKARIEAKRLEYKKPEVEPFEFVPNVPRITASTVEARFHENIRKLPGRSSQHVVAKWTVKERSQAKNLLDSYGAELTVKAVDLLFARWPELVANSKGKLLGDPTIGFLAATKAQFFGEAQLEGVKSISAKGKNSDEYQPRKVETDEEEGW